MQIIRGGVEDTRLEAKAKDTKKISRPRTRPRTKDTGASVLQKKEGFQKKVLSNLKKRSSKIFLGRKRPSKFFFRRFSLEKNKKGLGKFSARFLALSNKISTIQKIELSSSRGQGNFRGLEALRPRPRTSKSVLEDILEAKDVLEDSTSANYPNNNSKKWLK